MQLQDKNKYTSSKTVVNLKQFSEDTDSPPGFIENNNLHENFFAWLIAVLPN